MLPTVPRSLFTETGLPLTLDEDDEQQLGGDHHAIVVSMSDPRVMCWIGDTLLVASRTGQILQLRPGETSTPLLRWRAEPVAMVGGPESLTVACSGYIAAWDYPSGEVRWGQSMPLVQDIVVSHCGAMVVATGVDRHGHTRLLVIDADGIVMLEMELPSRTIAGEEEGGELFLARSTSEGLQKVVLFDPEMLRMPGLDGSALHAQFGTLPEGLPSMYRLRPMPGGKVIGVSHRSFALWTGRRGNPKLFSQPGLTCATLSPDDRQITLGTEQGNVLMASNDPTPRVPRRIGWVPGAVKEVAWSADGRWLAAMGNVCRVWERDQ